MPPEPDKDHENPPRPRVVSMRDPGLIAASACRVPPTGDAWKGHLSSRLVDYGRWLDRMRHALAGTLLLLLPLGACGGSSFVWTTNYYVVTGSNLREIRESLDSAHPPKITPPLRVATEWRVSWRFAVVPSAGGWRCGSFATRLVITNTLPRWAPPPNATPELQQAWQRFFRNLAQHEAGHSRIALAALAEAHQRVKELSDDPEWYGLRAKVNDVVRAVLDSYSEKERDYDERTQHGMRQGPVFLSPAGGRGARPGAAN
jgi:predicted secreted Zn-dependent protease